MSEIRVDLITERTADGGVTIKSTGTGDNKPTLLTLQTSEADIAANDVLGKIQFQAPDEGTGTDAILVSAAIQARSEGDFAADANATAIDFMVGASEAAATKMTLSSAGKLDVSGGIDIEGGAVFNEDSADVDFRVESNGNANMLKVDGGNNRVGVGCDPSADFHVDSSGGGVIRVSRNSASTSNFMALESDGTNGTVKAVQSLIVSAGGGEVARFTSGGLAIGGTGAANTFDDYEEGTWTATNTGGFAGDPTATCHYTKIGRVVYIASTFNFASANFLAENIIITGLPFATATDGDATADATLRAKMFGFVQRTDVPAEAVVFWSADTAGATTITLRFMGDNASTGQVQGVAASSVTPNFTISGFYFTDS